MTFVCFNDFYLKTVFVRVLLSFISFNVDEIFCSVISEISLDSCFKTWGIFTSVFGLVMSIIPCKRCYCFYNVVCICYFFFLIFDSMYYFLFHSIFFSQDFYFPLWPFWWLLFFSRLYFYVYISLFIFPLMLLSLVL